jgi:hypothetical protein
MLYFTSSAEEQTRSLGDGSSATLVERQSFIHLVRDTSTASWTGNIRVFYKPILIFPAGAKERIQATDLYYCKTLLYFK